MNAGIDYTRDGRTKRPARGREESGDCRNRKPAGLQGRRRRMASRVQGCCHRWRLEPQWTCLATPGARELTQLQRKGEEVFVSPFQPLPSTHLAVPPFSSLGKATTGIRPFDSEQGRERARNTPEENSQNLHCNHSTKVPTQLMWSLQDPAHIHPPAPGHCQGLQGLSS